MSGYKPLPLFVSKARLHVRKLLHGCLWVLGSRTAAMILGVALPAAWLLAVPIFDEVRDYYAFGTFFLFSMVALLVSAFARPKTTPTGGFIAGCVWGGAIFAAGFTYASAPLLLSFPLACLEYEHMDFGLEEALVYFGPFPATFTYLAHAWTAKQRLEGRFKRAFRIGICAPFVLTLAVLLSIHVAVAVCVHRMLVDDRQAALAAAEQYSRIPRTFVSWRPMVDAWLEARVDRKNTERSNQISDVFQRLTGHDLSKHYDSSIPY